MQDEWSLSTQLLITSAPVNILHYTAWQPRMTCKRRFKCLRRSTCRQLQQRCETKRSHFFSGASSHSVAMITVCALYLYPTHRDTRSWRWATNGGPSSSLTLLE